MAHYGRVIDERTVATACGVVGILMQDWGKVDRVACIEALARATARP